MWLGGHVCKNNTIMYSIYNSNLMTGGRHNGCKIKLAKYFQQESWTIFKRSEDFKHYLPITITNVTA
jgi:murein endopeptidase